MSDDIMPPDGEEGFKELDRRSRAMYAYLSQGETWFPNAKPAIAIADMDPAWRRNAAAFLVRKARNYLLQYDFGEVFFICGGVAREVIGEDDGKPVFGRLVSLGPSPDSLAERLFEQGLEEAQAERSADPEAWIKTTPLYKALVAGLPEGPDAQ